MFLFWDFGRCGVIKGVRKHLKIGKNGKIRKFKKNPTIQLNLEKTLNFSDFQEFFTKLPKNLWNFHQNPQILLVSFTGNTVEVNKTKMGLKKSAIPVLNLDLALSTEVKTYRK